MKIERDLSFDYGERRMEGGRPLTLNGLEYNVAIGPNDKIHLHFWVPHGVIFDHVVLSNLEKAIGMYLMRDKVSSASWDFAPAHPAMGQPPGHKRTAKLYLIDYRRSTLSDVEDPDQAFVVEKAIGTIEWGCPQGLSEESVRAILAKGNIEVHIRAPKKGEGECR